MSSITCILPRKYSGLYHHLERKTEVKASQLTTIEKMLIGLGFMNLNLKLIQQYNQTCI